MIYSILLFWQSAAEKPTLYINTLFRKKREASEMVTDFHTHVYPDKIAERTIQALMTAAPDVKIFTKGTLSALLESMKASGIDKSVILPVATKKGQFDTINRFALELNHNYKELVSFGGIHPDDENPEEKLQFLKDNGFKGIKIHPDYTDTFIDDERYIRIITACARLGLKVVTHSGADPAFKVIHCPPAKGREVLDKATKLTGTRDPFMVFAHLGGIYVHNEVLEHLVGTNCYIDISCSFAALGSYCDTSDEDVVELIRLHGADRILFATDSPWNDQKEYLEHFRALKGLSDKEKEMILNENAEKLLK